MHFSKVPAIAVLCLAVRCVAFPISFEKRDATHFLARFADGTSAELRPDRVILDNVTLRFVGATITARFEGLGPAAPATYLRAGVTRTFQQFPRTAIHNLYPGVDAIFYGNGKDLEYDLQLAAGASVDRIRISVEGSSRIDLNGQGDLIIPAASGVLQQMRPRVYQQGHEISARYVLFNNNEVGLKLDKYDRRAPLTVDPVLAYTKTFGATGSNSANLVTADSQGNIYVAGLSSGVDFPTTSNSFATSSFPPLRILSNAGQTINAVKAGSALSVGIVAAAQDGKILYASTPQGISLSVDSGATWRQTAPFPVRDYPNSSRTATVNAIAIDTPDPATVRVATTAGLFGSSDAGQSWFERHTGLNVSASGFVSVASVFANPVNRQVVYAITSGPSHLYASSDVGNTWRRLEPKYPGEVLAPVFPFSPNLAATMTLDGSLLYAINGNGTLLKSADGGDSWVKLADGLSRPASIQVDPSNASTLYVLDQDGVMRKSADGGLTFANVAAPIRIRSSAMDSAGILYLADFGPFIYMSDDGATFTAISSLRGVSSSTLSAFGDKIYVGSFSPGMPFVIKLDPSGSNILYSTFLGGSSGDLINGLSVDAQGNAVLVGTMISPDFPLTQPASSPPAQGKSDGFLTKLSADGTRLIYSIAVGAGKSVSLQAVALDSSGAAYVTGQSSGGDISTTPNVFQPAVPSTACPRPANNIFGPPISIGSSFVSKISADGKTTIYTTFLTGSCGSIAQAITTDSAGDAVVVGTTTSPDFPVSATSYQPAFPGPITQTNPPAILNAGFVAKLSPTGDKLLAGTFLGGGYSTQANSVALDPAGEAYVTGFTQGIVPGATPGALQTKLADNCIPTINIGPGLPYTGTGDAFVLKLDGGFSTARFLTYLGGSCNDSGSGIAVDTVGNIWISGISTSQDFPLKDPFQVSGLVGSRFPGFVSELSGDGSQLLFSSFSEGAALTVSQGAVYLAGASGLSAFVAKIDPAKVPAISVESVRPMTAFPPSIIPPALSAVAPGQWIRIRGRNLGPAAKVSAQLDATRRLPFMLGNTVVFFDNIPAPLLSVEASTIECFVPFEVFATSKVSVLAGGQVSEPVKTSVFPSSPQVLNILNADGTVNSADHPAKAGSVIAIYVSGLGQTNPLGADGLLNGAPLPAPLVPVTVFYADTQLGVSITPLYAGAAPGMIAGIAQVNVAVPVSVATGPASISVNTAGAKLYTTK